MSITSTPVIEDMSPIQRRDAIIAILAVGLGRFIHSRAAEPQELLESVNKGLEVSGETRLSVVRG